MVIKGIVREVSDDGEIIAVYHSNDTFDARALIAGQSVHRFEVHEEALVFSLPKELVMGLIESNPVFGAFFFQSVSENSPPWPSARATASCKPCSPPPCAKPV